MIVSEELKGGTEEGAAQWSYNGGKKAGIAKWCAA